MEFYDAMNEIATGMLFKILLLNYYRPPTKMEQHVIAHWVGENRKII